MYFLLGIENLLRNLFLLAQNTNPSFSNKKISLTDLRASYFDFLKLRLPWLKAYLSSINDDNPNFRVNDLELFKIFNHDTVFNDTKHFLLNAVDSNSTIEYLKKQFKELEEKNASFNQLFHLLVHTIFICSSKTAYGGTTSKLIGVLWVDQYINNLVFSQFFEFLAHELTHTLLFLDEWCHSHYTDVNKMSLRENYSVSAILQKKRPLDKVVHSIVIAGEVILLREKILGHPKQNNPFHPTTNILAKNTLASIKPLLNEVGFNSLLTQRTKFLLTNVQSISEKFV